VNLPWFFSSFVVVGENQTFLVFAQIALNGFDCGGRIKGALSPVGFFERSSLGF